MSAFYGTSAQSTQLYILDEIVRLNSSLIFPITAAFISDDRPYRVRYKKCEPERVTVCVLRGRDGRGLNQESVRRNNQLGVGVAAHTVDSTGGASSDGIGVTAWMFGGDGNGAIRAAYDSTLVIKRINTSEVDDEAGILRTAHKGDGGANLNAEDFVGFCVRYARGRGCTGAPAAPDVDGTGSGRGTTRVLCGAHACGIRSQTCIVLNFLFGVLTDHITGE
jgi:hypothetical protein